MPNPESESGLAAATPPAASPIPGPPGPSPSPISVNDRDLGDREGDALVSHMLGEGEHELDGRLGYNHLLDIADALVDAPELAFAKGSRVHDQLEAYRAEAPELAAFFDPVEAPEWLDEEQLAIASGIWQEYMLTVLTVLYARSLPDCYLMKRGIPALYASGKLAKKDYLFQRIYETGLMLDAVMREGGLRVSRDIDHDADDHLLQALQESAPADSVTKHGNKVQATGAQQLAHEEVAAALHRRADPQRYLWGPGFIAARKVRLLHASMRYLLQNPKRFSVGKDVSDKSLAKGLVAELAGKEWPADELGVPVNQQDLAYTLLTFGLAIPEGLERWHVKLSDKEQEAFLHAWRVVGWIIGIKDDLLPTSVAHARQLRSDISKEQAGATEMGRDMTSVLMQYMQDYLPHVLGLKTALPAWFIRDQMGKRAPDVLHPGPLKESKGLLVRTIGVILHIGLWAGFTARRLLFKVFPPLRLLVGSTLSEVGGALIDSWRDVYRRRPFYIPEDATTWKRKSGVNVPYLHKLMKWRRQLYVAAILGLTLWMMAGVAVITGLVALGLDQHWSRWCLWGAAGGFVLGVWLLQVTVPLIARRRPRIDSELVVQL